MVEDPVEDGELKNFGIIWTALKYFISPLICIKCTVQRGIIYFTWNIWSPNNLFTNLWYLASCSMHACMHVFSYTISVYDWSLVQNIVCLLEQFILQTRIENFQGNTRLASYCILSICIEVDIPKAGNDQFYSLYWIQFQLICS